MIRISYLICAIVLTFINWAAKAEDQPQFAVVGAWAIHVDTSIGYSCFVMAEFDGGSAVRFGFNIQDENLYILTGNPKWKSIEYGKTYGIELQFGDESRWNGDASGFSFDPPDNQPWLWLTIAVQKDSAVLFFQEFMQEQNLAVYYKDSSILNVNLQDSYKAGLKLFECQEAMAMISDDPFAEDVSVNISDPFAN